MHTNFYLSLCVGPPVGGTAAASPVVPPLEVTPTLEVLPSVISLGLAVAGVWKLDLLVVIQIQIVVVVRSRLCWSVLAVQLEGSMVDSLDMSITA